MIQINVSFVYKFKSLLIKSFLQSFVPIKGTVLKLLSLTVIFQRIIIWYINYCICIMYFFLSIKYMYDIFYIYFLLSIEYNGKCIQRFDL